MCRVCSQAGRKATPPKWWQKLFGILEEQRAAFKAAEEAAASEEWVHGFDEPSGWAWRCPSDNWPSIATEWTKTFEPGSKPFMPAIAVWKDGNKTAIANLLSSQLQVDSLELDEKSMTPGPRQLRSHRQHRQRPESRGLVACRTIALLNSKFRDRRSARCTCLWEVLRKGS